MKPKKLSAIICQGILSAFIGGISLDAALAQEQTPPNRWISEWPQTDFTISSIDFGDVLDGGPPRDGIPAIDEPALIPASEEGGLDPREPVIVVEVDGEARAYPIQYLTWHEIVNDRFGERPVSVTFCPLCNSAIVFDGRLGDQELTFGVSGKLRNSDMIMYDRETESWWQQFTGEGIVGDLTGETLTVIPSAMVSWAEFLAEHPDGDVMARPTGFLRAYGRNPYVNYDSSARPFLYSGERPPHGIEPLARVVRVDDRAWPLLRLREAGEIVEAGVRLTWASGQASALDSGLIAEGRDVGTVRAFDAETGEPIVYEVVFAFAFHAFEPDGEWMLGDG